MADSVQNAYKTFGFGMKAFKKFPELIPLVAILSVPCLGAISYMSYALYHKSDVWILKNSTLPPWERVDAEKSQKLLTLKQEYAKIPELEQLKKEIGSYSFGKLT